VLSDSGAVDSLFGVEGTDWFFQSVGDIVADFTADVKTV
jgi:hypothetical protein